MEHGRRRRRTGLARTQFHARPYKKQIKIDSVCRASHLLDITIHSKYVRSDFGAREWQNHRCGFGFGVSEEASPAPVHRQFVMAAIRRASKFAAVSTFLFSTPAPGCARSAWSS